MSKKPTAAERDNLLARALQALHEAVGLGNHSPAIDEAVAALSGEPAPPVGGGASAEPEAPTDAEADVPAEQPPPESPEGK